MAKIPSGAWVVVGDGEKALFLRNEGEEAFPKLAVIRELEHANPPTREQGTDTPGRMADGSRPGRTPQITHMSAVEETDWHRLEKARFAKELADRLYKAAHAGAYDKLIVAAPPVVLGEIRKSLHKEVESRLLFDLPKELTNHTVDGIETAIADA
jgi:protein required for attachment to host cells